MGTSSNQTGNFPASPEPEVPQKGQHNCMCPYTATFALNLSGSENYSFYHLFLNRKNTALGVIKTNTFRLHIKNTKFETPDLTANFWKTNTFRTTHLTFDETSKQKSDHGRCGCTPDTFCRRRDWKTTT